MQNLSYLIALIVSLLIILGLFVSVQLSKSKKQLHQVISLLLVGMFIWTLSLVMQILFQNTSVSPIFFEGLASFGACFVPVFILLLGLTFNKTKLNFNWKYLLLFIIPCITTILMFTNDAHHLLYKSYSVYLNDTISGAYMNVHSMYSYLLILIGIIQLLQYTIKNSGFFSRPSLLIVIGSLIPILLNVAGTFRIIPMTVYVTPISFSIALLFYAFAIFKFKFLNLTPIALQNVVDRISDGYLVLNEDDVITDFNKTFINIFNLTKSNIRNFTIQQLLHADSDYNIDIDKFTNAIKKVKNSNKTITFEQAFNKIDKVFTVEITAIYSKKMFIGTLVLFKDITQHVNDMRQIKDNQETLMEKERLASLGQLIGGIAHNLKTPIMSIAGAAEGLSDLVKEYDSSIDDPEVNSQDHHEIASDMSTWIAKIKTHTEYMSDVITAVKGQAVSLVNEEDINFSVEELLKRVDILMRHELKNAIIYLNVAMKTDEKTIINGDVNSLVQVINNMISNSIQPYAGQTDKNIDLIVERQDDNLVLTIKDYASGMPESVKDKLFKEMVTTKGKNGTGLGLYMSYSTIRAHFNGNITVDSEEGKRYYFSNHLTCVNFGDVLQSSFLNLRDTLCEL